MTERNGNWTEHLEELRRRIIYVLVVYMTVVCGLFILSPRIVNFLMAPVSHLNVKLYAFSPTEKFTTYLHLSAWAGVFITAPFFLVQLALFIWPGLKKGERKASLFALLGFPLLFLSGSAIAYLFLSPVVLGFFLSFGSGDGIESLWSLKSYVGLLLSMMLGAGLLLQVPLILLAAFGLGITTPQRVARLRAHIVLFIFFLSALLTPPDVITQIMLGIPLYLLFELSMIIGRYFFAENA